jgi:hypothetical protein
MPRTQTAPPVALPKLPHYLLARTVEDLKWYATVFSGKLPLRKGELTVLLVDKLTDPAEVRQLWERLEPGQQHVLAEVVHNLEGRYNKEVLEAKYPGVAAPVDPRYGGSLGMYYTFGSGKKQATPFDVFFGYSYELGYFVASDLAALLRSFVPPPPPFEMRSFDDVPPIARPGQKGPLPELMVSKAEPAVFHDLAATLYQIQEGKLSVSASTGQPTLGSLRQLRTRLLIGDYFADREYERAEDAIRPFALVMLAQAARWAAPATSGGKLELTKEGLALLPGPVQARHVRDAWKRWLKSDLLDELSRIRAIKGQQSKDVRLTKPAPRREKLAAVLQAAPVERWVALDDFFRYMRATEQSPAVERTASSGLRLGAYAEYGWLGYSASSYWDVVIGSYLRAVLWEYAATLGLIEIAYTYPEESPHDFGGNDELYDYDYLSRYDGLWALRVTNLGAYVFGLTNTYIPPVVEAERGPVVLKVLPNLDVVITDPANATLNDRSFLERIGTSQSQDVYRLTREQLLGAVEQGLTLEHVRGFLVNKSGSSEEAWPQTVRVFFSDLEQRLQAVRESGRMLLLEGEDPYVLTELAHAPDLRAAVRLGTVDGKTVLLVPEEREADVRRRLRKLGYLPRKS